MPDRLSSSELLLAIREGSIEAFNELYRQYMPLVMHIALHIVQDRMEAEEVSHDVFLEVLRRSAQYDSSRGSLDAWIAVIARSRSMDMLRKKQRRAAGETDMQEQEWYASTASVTPEVAALRSLDREVLQEALAELPITQKKAIYAAYYEEKTQKEMALDWKVPLGTVKSWVRYGIGNLRKQLERKGWHEATNERSDSYDRHS